MHLTWLARITLTEDLTAARIARGSIYLTFQNVVSTLIGVVGFAFMARIITEEEMGVIAGVALLTSLVQLASDFGLNSSIAKHVSEMEGRGQDLSRTVISAVAFRIPVCILLSSLMFFFSSDISLILFKTNVYALAISLLSLDAVLLSLTPLLSNVLLGKGRMRSIAFFGIWAVVARWFSITVLLLAGLGIDGIVLGWILGDLALLLMLTFRVRKLVSLKRAQPLGKHILPLLKFAFPLYVASAVSFVYTWYDKAIILAYLPLSDLGIYNIAFLAFSVLATISGALGAALLPFYGKAYGQSDHQAISSGVKRASKYGILVLFPLALGLAAASKPTLALFAGSRYSTGWTALAVLALFGLVYGITPALSNLLLIYGKTKTILLLSFIPVVSSLALLPLIWVSGLIGLAIMKGTSLLLSLILTIYFLNRTVKMQIDKPTLTKVLTASTMMATIVLALQLALYNSRLLPLYILAGAVTYIALVRTLKVFDKEDIQLIRQVMGKTAAKNAAKILGVSSEPVRTEK